MNRIQHFREATRLSREDLANAIGRKEAAVGHYELGRRIPGLELARKIVKALNAAGNDCSLDDVFPPVRAPKGERKNKQVAAQAH